MPGVPDEPEILAMVSRLGVYEVTSMASAALGAWHPSARPGASISLARRTASRRGWVLRGVAFLTIVGIPWAWARTSRHERFDLTAVPVKDPQGLVHSHVFIESTLTGRAAARLGALLEILTEPASEPARQNWPSEPGAAGS